MAILRNYLKKAGVEPDESDEEDLEGAIEAWSQRAAGRGADYFDLDVDPRNKYMGIKEATSPAEYAQRRRRGPQPWSKADLARGREEAGIARAKAKTVRSDRLKFPGGDTQPGTGKKQYEKDVGKRKTRRHAKSKTGHTINVQKGPTKGRGKSFRHMLRGLFGVRNVRGEPQKVPEIMSQLSKAQRNELIALMVAHAKGDLKHQGAAVGKRDLDENLRHNAKDEILLERWHNLAGIR